MIGDSVDVDIQGAINAGIDQVICESFKYRAGYSTHIYSVFIKRIGKDF